MTTFVERPTLDHSTLCEDPTLYSNRLIGLAISVDSEFSNCRRLENDKKTLRTSAKTPGLRAALSDTIDSDFTLLPVPDQPQSQSIKRKVHRSFDVRKASFFGPKKTPGVTIRPCGNSQKQDMNVEEMTGLNGSSSSKPKTSRSSPWASLHNFKESPNLITVFSSPCPDYYISSSRRDQEDMEPPEYVRMMMEKDVALRRLVKTGCITISRINAEAVGSGSEEESKWDDADEIKKSRNMLQESQDCKTTNGFPRPYEPPANIRDWTNFPFAKKLLEFTYAAIATSDTKYPNGSSWKGVSSSSSGSYPGSSASSKSCRDSELLQYSIHKASSNGQVKRTHKTKQNWTDSRTSSAQPRSNGTSKLQRPIKPQTNKTKAKDLAGFSLYNGNNVPSIISNSIEDASTLEDSIDPSSFLEVSSSQLSL